MKTAEERARYNACWGGRDFQERRRLILQCKPTIVKSLVKPGWYYCGINVAQSHKYAAAHWGRPQSVATLGSLTYGRGRSPIEAYSAWRKVYVFVNRKTAGFISPKTVDTSVGQSVKMQP